MTLAVLPAKTGAGLSGLDLLEKAFSGQDFGGSPGYVEPYVIMERLATDFPEPLSTVFYTSAYMQRNNVQPKSEHVFQFPDGFTLEAIVQRFQAILRITSIPHVMMPESVKIETEFVTFKYKPRYPIDSYEYANVFQPLLHGALGLVIKEFQGRQLNETKPQ